MKNKLRTTQTAGLIFSALLGCWSAPAQGFFNSDFEIAWINHQFGFPLGGPPVSASDAMPGWQVVFDGNITATLAYSYEHFPSGYEPAVILFGPGRFRGQGGGGRGPKNPANVAQASGPSPFGGDPRINRQALSSDAKKELRNEARNIWQELTGRRARWDDLQVHHRVPLEYAHLFRANPNRVSNLIGVNERVHGLINNAWTAFRTALNGRTPTPSEVIRQAIRIDNQFGDSMRFIR